MTRTNGQPPQPRLLQEIQQLNSTVEAMMQSGMQKYPSWVVALLIKIHASMLDLFMVSTPLEQLGLDRDQFRDFLYNDLRLNQAGNYIHTEVSKGLHGATDITHYLIIQLPGNKRTAGPKIVIALNGNKTDTIRPLYKIRYATRKNIVATFDFDRNWNNEMKFYAEERKSGNGWSDVANFTPDSNNSHPENIAIAEDVVIREIIPKLQQAREAGGAYGT